MRAMQAACYKLQYRVANQQQAWQHPTLERVWCREVGVGGAVLGIVDWVAECRHCAIFFHARPTARGTPVPIYARPHLYAMHHLTSNIQQAKAPKG